MPTATLLLRETNSSSLSSIVEKSQSRKPPLFEYDLRLRSCQLDLVLVGAKAGPASGPDEGFESDADSLSIVSSDDSFPTPPNGAKAETDSANGSACSDTDDEPKGGAPPEKETHDLVDCVCYSDVKFPDLLVFVIESDALVFKFASLEQLRKFHANFNTLKAVTNQKAYGRNVGAKFNLLQRTDNDGVTHIEISREPIEGFAPKKPERRKKPKGKAPPPPPINIEENVFKGEYVRVTVPKIDVITEKLSRNFIGDQNDQFNIYSQPKLTTYQQFKYITETTKKHKTHPETWTSSLKMRSKSETRGFTPMAYRYIDTTMMHSPMYSRKYKPHPIPISNRLFGMSSKLKDFSGQKMEARINDRWNSLSELSGTNLKSVIKKEDAKKKEKKVTFSAYTTVQVV